MASGTGEAAEHLTQHATFPPPGTSQGQAFATVHPQPQPLMHYQPQHRQPARILPLSPEAISQIHSSKHITDLQGVICSLLENSLDAGANKVDISVDWRRGGCTVADNGTGIPAAEFLENGGLGKMYCTSKQHAGTGTKQTHGKAGTFLAELGSMSLLSITSEQEGGGAESVFTMHNGKVIPSQPTADGQTTMPSFAELHRRHGTIVTVRDLFGNMPVRVKQRAHATESAYDQDKAWQKLKRDVVALLLAWHTPCAVKLRDTNTESRRSHLMSGASGALTERALAGWSSKSVKYDIRDAMPVVFQAGLAPTESRGRWIPLSASTSMATLRGMICLHAAPTRRCQFLAIGITPCSSHEFLHAVNKVFESSSFGAVEDSTERDSRNRGKLPNGHVSLDRHPMYVLQLDFAERGKCAPADNAHLSEATIQSLARLLEAAVQAWLESNHFRPRKTKKRRRRNMEQGSPAAAIEGGDGNVAGERKPTREPGTSSTADFAGECLQHADRPDRALGGGEGKADRPMNLPRGPSADSTQRLVVRNAFGGTTDSSSAASEANDTASARIPQRPDQRKHRRVFDLSTARPPSRSNWLNEFDDTRDRHTLSRARSGTSRALPNCTLTPEQHHCCQSVRTASEAAAWDSKKLFAPPISAGELNGNAAPLRSPCHSKPRVATPSSDDFGAVDDEDLFAAEQESELAQDDTTPRLDNNTVWIDPISKQVFQVNSRTGVVLPISETHRTTSSCGPAQEQRHRAAIDTAVSSAGRPMSLARRSALASTRPQSAVSDKDKWLPGFLEEWKNPVFAKRKEEPIPTASISGPGLIEQLEEDRRCCAADKYQQAFPGHGAKTGGLGGTKLSKYALSDAEVIGQVDRKFILVRMPARCHNHDDEPTHDQNGAGSTLVLIDQHAASERIILEDLLADMLLTPTADNASNQQTFPGPIVKTSSLVHSTTRAKSLIFEVSTHEHELFSRHLSHFTYWGITYQLPSPTSAHSPEGSPPQSRRRSHHHQHRLVVTHLPTVIAERCSHFPALAIELLRTELWAIEDGSRKPITSTTTNREPSPTTWLSLLPRMPTKLLHMIQSRACRSAIMFNDILPTAECRDTVTNLGNCIFPFVCAHGRCGVVPVMDLGSSSCSSLNNHKIGVGREENEKEKEEQEEEEANPPKKTYLENPASQFNKLLSNHGEVSFLNDNRETKIEFLNLGKLRQFMLVVEEGVEEEEDENEDEDEDEDQTMTEQSPHKFG